MVSIVFENTIGRAYVGRMLPTLRQLHYLKLLAEHASFSRAAAAAHVSQPALSAGVQELEKILGAGRETQQGDIQARERFDRELDNFHRDPDAWKRSHPYDSDRKRYRYDEDDYYRHKKKKKGFDIFDIFD